MTETTKHQWIRIVLAVLAGFVLGSVVNMGLIALGGSVAPPPAGADTMEGLAASMPLFEPKHFVFPFLAHALGTLAGATVAAAIAPARKLACAMAVGTLFFLGGVAAVAILPAPLWFEALDLVAAYFPMAWLGHTLVARRAQAA